MAHSIQTHDIKVYCVYFTAERLVDFDVTVTNSRPPAAYGTDRVCQTQTARFTGQLTLFCENPLQGRYIAVRFHDKNKQRILTICELEILYGRKYLTENMTVVTSFSTAQAGTTIMLVPDQGSDPVSLMYRSHRFMNTRNERQIHGCSLRPRLGFQP